MIKRNWKKILIILILIVMSASIGAYATSYLLNATQVSYGSGSVKTALDDLYAKATSQAFGPVNKEQIANFGKTVTGTSVPSGTWRIFYADSEYVYLLRDSIGNYALNTLDGFGTSTISLLGKKLNGKFTASSSSIWSNKSSNNNIKGVAVLLDTTKWTTYKSGDAIWAIGSPTLEMFVESYNATHDTTHYSALGVSNIQISCHYDSTSYTGYKVSKNGGSQSTYITGLGNTVTLDKKIYCPSSGYWFLASPSALDGGCVIFVDNYDGGTLNRGTYDYAYGIRPLVAIPISKINNGITIGSL